jgi:hypothetical protein
VTICFFLKKCKYLSSPICRLAATKTCTAVTKRNPPIVRSGRHGCLHQTRGVNGRGRTPTPACSPPYRAQSTHTHTHTHTHTQAICRTPVQLSASCVSSPLALKRGTGHHQRRRPAPRKSHYLGWSFVPERIPMQTRALFPARGHWQHRERRQQVLVVTLHRPA